MYTSGEFYKIEIEKLLIEQTQILESNEKIKKEYNALQTDFQTQFCSRKLSDQTRLPYWCLRPLFLMLFFVQNWHSIWKAQKALEKISNFATMISESYNQDDAEEIENIMKLASQMGSSLKLNHEPDEAWAIFSDLYHET